MRRTAGDTVTYLTTDDVADRYRTTAPTIRYWRHIGSGPQGVKIGRRVLYPLGEVVRWEREKQAEELAGGVAGA